MKVKNPPHPNFLANEPIRGSSEGICRVCGEYKVYRKHWGFCCVDCNNRVSRQYWADNKHRPEIVERRRETARVYARHTGIQKRRTKRNAFKEELYERLGGKCACCDEKEIMFLSIDHINNDGNVHRKEIGRNIIAWFQQISPDIPEGFQLLCRNCNWGKHINKGICPHQGGVN